jgi:hypothetical protein
MASFVFDIAFDWNATPNAANQLPLYIGFVNVTSASTPAPIGSGPFAYTIAMGDSFFFNGFNITNGGTGYSISSGSLAFLPALLGQMNASPIASASLSNNLSGASTQSGSSSIFTTGTFPMWNPVFASQEIINTGSFLFTVSLTIEGPGGTKIFVIDPEMIVQATGGGTIEERFPVNR